ncbi:hypothetical protein RND71_018452 [Anisodus tanguticus]|uniref:Protein kinase domain-containing protein n=1 Tax=Anisodus tanguticus TaxID=243964 RepID=A0AAE1S4A7_9SOLA|nr:hypothetical protein RND71_018452 [Anisodus tanguticus]
MDMGANGQQELEDFLREEFPSESGDIKMDMGATREFLAVLKVLTNVHHLNLSKRVQITLNAARGLEYIHEHPLSVYIYRDIKTANILIDKNLHAKFEVLNHPDSDEDLRKLVDPRLGDDYPLDSVPKVAKVVSDPIITPKMLQTNPVKKLYDTCQKHKLTIRVVDMWSHDGSFEVFIDNQLSGKGMCHVKK